MAARNNRQDQNRSVMSRGQLFLISVLFLTIACVSGCSRNAVLGLMHQLQDQNVEVRRRAAASLLNMGRDATPAIEALGGAVADKDREVRRLAIRALGQLGPESTSSLPLLNQSLTDQELSVRLAAAMAIQELDPAEKKHTAILIDAMKKGEGGTIVAVGKFGDRAAWAVPTLRSLLQDHRAGIRRIAADALRDIGPAAAAAEDALRRAAKDDTDDRVRSAAQEALAAVSKA
jgi:HEAT repeat protein